MPPQRKNEVKRLLLNITRYFLPILFVSYLVSFTFFAHVHVVNGVTIVHSHPFKKGAAHKHPTVELQLIHFIPFLLCLLLGRSQHSHYHCPYHGVVGLRAPPVIRFSVL